MTDHLPATPIADSYWVSAPGRATSPTPGRLLAGEYPYAKDHADGREKLGHFLDAGVTTFIDLTEEDEHRLHPYAAEVIRLADPRGLPVAHRRLSIPDLGVPSPEHMTRTLNVIDEALARGETVYVHCYGGIGRTGTVVGCWLVRRGLSGQAALDQIAGWRQGTPDGYRRSPETDEQRQFVLGWAG